MSLRSRPKTSHGIAKSNVSALVDHGRDDVHGRNLAKVVARLARRYAGARPGGAA